MNLEIILATGNQHKLKEVREILSPHGITAYGLKDVNIDIGEVEENGKDYYENALIKAKAVQQFTNLPIIADDTGLEIDAMDNKPGLYTARFAQECGGHDKAFAKIFNILKDKDNRKARFICDIVLLNVEDKPLRFEGIVEGKIADKIEGEGGFGYDPIFIPDEVGVSYAKMPQEVKNKVSHRAKALIKLITYLRVSDLAR